MKSQNKFMISGLTTVTLLSLYGCYSHDLGSQKADRVPVNLSLTDWENGAGLVIQQKCATCHTAARQSFVPANTPHVIDGISDAGFFENRKNRNLIKEMLERVDVNDDSSPRQVPSFLGRLTGFSVNLSSNLKTAQEIERDDHGGGHHGGGHHGGGHHGGGHHGGETGDDHGGHRHEPGAGDDDDAMTQTQPTQSGSVTPSDSSGQSPSNGVAEGEHHGAGADAGEDDQEGIMPPKFATPLYPEEKEALVEFLKARLRAFESATPPVGPIPPSNGDDHQPPSTTLKFADVEPIVLANCAKSGCHDGVRRLFALKTREDFLKRKPMPLDALSSGDMPADNPDFRDSDDGKKLIQYLLGPQSE